MTNIVSESTQPVGTYRRVSWGAVFAGVIAIIVLQLLFTLLGAGIGAAKVDPLQESDPGKGLGIGAAIWFFLSTLVSVYLGARVAGYLSARAVKSDRMLHGLLTWGLATILGMAFLATAAGALFGGAASFLGSATAARANRNEPAYANSRYEQQGSSTTTRSALTPTGREEQSMEGLSPDERARQVQFEQRAREDKAARRVSQAALWSFLVLALSGVVAAFGGANAIPRERLDGTHFTPNPEPVRGS
jgi:hypothetical protein